MNTFGVYVLTYNNNERKKKMENRFISLNIDANIIEGNSNSNNRLSDIMESHMNNINLFYNSDNQFGIMCEDDIYLHKLFKNKINDVIDDLIFNELDIVLLGYLINSFPDNYGTLSYVSKNNNFYTYNDNLWGSHCYLITKKYAKQLIDYYNSNKKISDSPDWIITKLTKKRRFVWPPLAVEEGIVKTNDQGQINFHHSCKNFLYNTNYI